MKGSEPRKGFDDEWREWLSEETCHDGERKKDIDAKEKGEMKKRVSRE